MKNLPKPDGLKLPNDNCSGPNCGVTAIAVAAGISFDRVWAMFQKYSKDNRDNKRWRGSTYDYERRQIMDVLKIKYKTLTFKEIYGQTGKGHPTLQKFIEYATRKDEIYVITTTGHVQVVQNGWVIDQGGPKPIAEYRARRAAVRNVEVITPKRAVSSKNKYANMHFEAVHKINPRRENTFGHHSYQIVADNKGISYEDFISKGGRSNDLKWDIEHGNIVETMKQRMRGNNDW